MCSPDVSPRNPLGAEDGEKEDALEPLAARGSDESAANKVKRGMWLMSFWFAVNHGAITTGLALASTVLGTDLGGLGNGTLYLVYTATALCLAPAVIGYCGEKVALTAGLSLYTFYLAAFLVALQCDPRDDPDEEGAALCAVVGFVGGSFIGGFAAGFYWTAQAAYFGTAAARYATLLGRDRALATGQFSALFSATYLGCELACKLFSFALLQSIDDEQEAQNILFVVLTVLAVVSSVGMHFVPSLHSNLPKKRPTLKAALGTLKMTFTDPVIFFLIPYNFSFGLVSSFINNVVNARIIKVYLGSWAVPLLSAGISGVAAASAFPFNWFTTRFGSKLPTLLAGSVLFVVECVIYLAYAEESLGSWPVMLPLIAVQGLTRAVWEGPLKAAIADFYPEIEQRSFAFTCVVLQNGVSSSVGFFLFPPLLDAHGKDPLAIVCLAFSILCLCGVPGSFAFARRRLSAARSPLLCVT
ncbi:hypothetical protein DIPPA_17665 [Diplonema papillatum]|nr:hypothetical protein DIPPA_17665 [Diplonema papillatum]